MARKEDPSHETNRDECAGVQGSEQIMKRCNVGCFSTMSIHLLTLVLLPET